MPVPAFEGSHAAAIAELQHRRDRAVAALGHAFADVARPVHVTGCPCCIGRVDLPALLATPRTAIAADPLSFYVMKAFTTVGGIVEWQWFTPRIVELLVQGGLLCDDEIALGRFGLAQLSTWTSPLRTAVVEVLSLELRRRVHALAATTPDAPDEATAAAVLDAWLCGLVRATPVTTWTTLLDRAEGPVHAAAVLRLRQLVTAGGLDSAFWRDVDEARVQLGRWATALQPVREEAGLFTLLADVDGALHMHVEVELGGGAVTTVRRVLPAAQAAAVWQGSHDDARACAWAIADAAR